MTLLPLACGAAEDSAVPDASPPPADASSFTVGSHWPGENGRLAVELLGADPMPPQRDLNEWELQVGDASGAPQSGCELGVGLYMPAHGHAAPAEPTVAPGDSPGRYRLSDLNFSMPGTWEVTFELTCGALTDRVVASVEIAR